MPEAVDVDSAKALEALAEARTEGAAAAESQPGSTADAALDYLATPEKGARAQKASIRLGRTGRSPDRWVAGDGSEARGSSARPRSFLRNALALLLMSMGLVLVGLSTVTVVLLSARKTAAASEGTVDPLAQLGPPLVMLSCPLALLLLAGAWLLRLQGRRTGQRTERPGGLR